MHIQPIMSQPNFNGKLIFKDGAENLNKFTPDLLWRKFKEVNSLLSEKPYDIFILKNSNSPEFYNISANKSFEEAQKIKEYTVKIHSNALAESLVDAAKEAMEMYEKYIAKGIRS